MEEEAEARRARLLALRTKAASAAGLNSTIGAVSSSDSTKKSFQQTFAPAQSDQGPRAAPGFYSSLHLPVAVVKPPHLQQQHVPISSDAWSHMISSPAPPPIYGGFPPQPPAQWMQQRQAPFPPPQHQQPPFGGNPMMPQGGHPGRGSGPPCDNRGGGAGGSRGGRGGNSGGGRGGRGGGGGGGHHHGGGGGHSYYKSSFVEDPWAALAAAHGAKPPKLPRTM
jgi:hypothetical protein